MGLWRLGWGKHILSYEYSRITWNYMLGNYFAYANAGWIVSTDQA